VSASASAILEFMRNGDRSAAEKLARTMPELDIFEASALGALEHLIERTEEDALCVNGYCDEGATPLQLAAQYGNAACVKELLRRGADLHAIGQNEGHQTALEIATACGDEEIVRILRAAGERGHTPT
jgi:ankyrin repeat protein